MGSYMGGVDTTHPHCPVLAESSWSNSLPTLSAIPSVYCITVALLAVQIC